MPTSLVVFVALGLIALCAVFILIILAQNQMSRSSTTQFLEYGRDKAHKKVMNIRALYTKTNDSVIIFYPNSRIDVYLYPDFMVLTHRMKRIVTIYSLPILIATPDREIDLALSSLPRFNFKKILFKTVLKDQIDLSIQDYKEDQLKIDITFRQLTTEQLDILRAMENINTPLPKPTNIKPI